MDLDKLTQNELYDSVLNCIETKKFNEYPEPIQDLILADDYLSRGGTVPQTYTESTIRKLPMGDLQGFGRVFNLNPHDLTFIDRLVRILRFLDALELPSFSKSPHTIKSDLFVVPDISVLIGRQTKRLGEGTYGNVYQTSFNYAVKIIKSRRVDMNMVVETSILRYLDHPNVVNLIGVQLTPPKIGMPLAIGTLKDFDLVNLKTRKAIFYQIFRGLAYCHSKHVWHLDIKPDNILLFDNGEWPVAKLTDFGLSRVYARQGNTSLNVITLPWRPPEILLGDRNYNSLVDVWSVGVMLINSIMGDRFLYEFNEYDQLIRILDLLGSPTDQEWSGHKGLHEWNSKFNKYRRTLDLRKVDSKEAEVINSTLTWPTSRLSALDILGLPYFDDVRDRVETDIPAKPIQTESCGDLIIKEQKTMSKLGSKRDTVLEIIWELVLEYKFERQVLFYTIILYDLISSSIDIPIGELLQYIVSCMILSSYLFSRLHYGMDEFLMAISSKRDEDLINPINNILTIRDFEMVFPTVDDFIYEYGSELTDNQRDRVGRVAFLLYFNSEYVLQYTPAQLAQISFEALSLQSSCLIGKLYTEDIYLYLIDISSQVKLPNFISIIPFIKDPKINRY